MTNPSRSTDDDSLGNLTKDTENAESSDPETATEVSVSEKTLKFKISTEGTLSSPTTGRESYPGSRKGSREKSSLDYHNYDLVKTVREHEPERRRSKCENFDSDLSSPTSARSTEGTRILEEMEKDEETPFLDAKIEGKVPEGNGNVVAVKSHSHPRNNLKKGSNVTENDQEIRSSRKDAHSSHESIALRCCCDDKTGPNNKSLLSRLRNLTDRLSISFDSKDSPSPKPKHASKMLNKSNSVSSSSRHTNLFICKRCNLIKSPIKDNKGAIATIVELSSVDKRAMTLPKVRKSADSRNRSWRTVFAKEKRSSTSLEALPAVGSSNSFSKHRRNLSNPEGKSQSLREKTRHCVDIEFQEIDMCSKKQPEIIVNPDDSCCDIEDDLGKVEIRRSSASMEDISKMAKQAEATMLGSLDPKKAEERPHGSLDSMLCKEVCKSRKKSAMFSSPATSKKSSPGLFSRFKSGMSIDSTRSNSNSDSLHDHGSQTGWISSLTASFRPKRHPNDTPLSPHPPRSPSREEIK